MATLTLGVARSNSLGLYLQRVLPSAYWNGYLKYNDNASQTALFQFLRKFIIDGLPEFFGKTGFLLAVPKRRVSHSRKRIRNFPKFPKNRTDIEICPVCRYHKLQGHLCGYCLERIRAETAEVQAEMPSYDLPQSMSR